MSLKPLPVLEVGQAYSAVDFDRFQYSSARGPEGSAALLLHLSNGTTIHLPASDQELARLMRVLVEAYPEAAIAHLKARNWI